ncbi:MAG: DUF5995 family protein [Bacteroidia bacterium]
MTQLPSTSVLAKMEAQVNTWKENQDKRHVFLNCYRLMTQNMHNALADTAFLDANWVHILLERFADYYFIALEQYENKQTAPLVWADTHTSAQHRSLNVYQLLLTGVNSHINYDLVLVLVELLEDEWQGLTEEEKELRYRDYAKVNEVIAATIDKVQDEVIELENPLYDWLDKLMGRTDEWLVSQLINAWREEVWQDAVTILSANHTEEKIQYINKVTEKVLRRNAKMLWL